MKNVSLRRSVKSKEEIEMTSNMPFRMKPFIGGGGENLESMYIRPEKGEKVGKCMVTGRRCDYKDGRGKARPGRCEACSYAG